jgi:FtsZ-interacting cell division protein ZipA
MSGTVLAIIIIVAVIVVIAAVVLAVVQSRRRRTLKDRFGPEYDRTIDVTDSKRQAHKDLRDRAAQRDQLEIRELTPAAASRYQEQWTLVQQQFVDTPAEAVREAQQLVTTVMRERGYPTDDHDERESMLSVDHSDIVDRYRTASQIESRSQAGKATTEDLRQAMQHYRSLFDALLGDSLATTGATTNSGATTTGNVNTRGMPAGGTTATARPGTPASPDA